MMQTIIGGTITGVIILVVGALAARLLVSSKTEDAMYSANRKIHSIDEKLSEHIVGSENRNILILESLLTIMLTMKKFDNDEKIDKELKKLNDYIINKSAK